jgi:hypothetical protein
MRGIVHPDPPRPSRQPASAQETTLDLLWIEDGVAAFAGGRGAWALYRAVLAVEGPAHTPRALAASESGVLAGYRGVLDRLDHAVQVVVRAAPFDTRGYAARWEERAAVLPGPMASLAREHAAWARRELPEVCMLVRRAYLVVPAEDLPAPASPTASFRKHLGRGRLPAPGVEDARAVLAERCARLQSGLGAAGVRATRLDDLGLAQLYRACWSPSTLEADSSDRDLAALFEKTS